MVKTGSTLGRIQLVFPYICNWTGLGVGLDWEPQPVHKLAVRCADVCRIWLRWRYQHCAGSEDMVLLKISTATQHKLLKMFQSSFVFLKANLGLYTNW